MLFALFSQLTKHMSFQSHPAKAIGGMQLLSLSLSFISPEQTSGLPALIPSVISRIKGLLSLTTRSPSIHTDTTKDSEERDKAQTCRHMVAHTSFWEEGVTLSTQAGITDLRSGFDGCSWIYGFIYLFFLCFV